ncbi:MAG: DUF1588 domain-containing protein, partial [Myxococcota bacterium]|nr:DUF1588 domain-containing protein [Myxococcota bacterium]
PSPGSSDSDGFGPVDTSETPYGGILTDGGVLTTHAFANGSSPIHRGLFVREQLLCQELPLPPPGIVAEPPAMDPNATTRERFTAHAELEECAGCHRLIDPIGFALEHFDGVGRYRETENDLPIDATGEIVGTGYTNGTFDGAEALATLLAESPETHRCFAQQWLRFAYGMEVSAGMKCLLDDIAATFEDDGHRVRALLRALATSAHATTRADAVVVELEPEPPPVVIPETGDEPDAGASPDAGAPDDDVGPATGEVSTEVSVESSWGAGHCDQVTVTNDGGTSVTWAVTLDVNGVLTQVWEATHTPTAEGLTLFKGATWNHTLSPGQSTSFGYCADTNLAEMMGPPGGDGGGGEPGGGGPSSDDLEITIESYTDWGTGYCANGAVTNVGDTTTTWGFSWSVDGEIYNVWEATATPMGDQVYFTGVASNATLGPGQTANFGFCANL